MIFTGQMTQPTRSSTEGQQLVSPPVGQSTANPTRPSPLQGKVK